MNDEAVSVQFEGIDIIYQRAVARFERNEGGRINCEQTGAVNISRNGDKRTILSVTGAHDHYGRQNEEDVFHRYRASMKQTIVCCFYSSGTHAQRTPQQA